MRTSTRRLMASFAGALTVLTIQMSAAFAAASPTPVDPVEQGKRILRDQQNAGVDFTIAADNPWIWGIVALIVGAASVAAAIFGGLLGGLKLAFARDDKTKVQAAVATIRNSTFGILVMIGSGAFIISVIIMMVTIIT